MTTTGSATTAVTPIARRRLLTLTVVVPLALCLAAAAVTASWLPEVPSRVAVHWGPGGDADGFAPSWAYPALLAGLGLLLAACFGLPTAATRRGGLSAQQKVLAAVATGASALLATVLTGGLAMQRGAEAGDAVPGVGGVLLAGAVAGLALGGTAWLMLPPAQPGQSDRVAVRELALAETERLVWIRSETPARVFTVMAVVVVGALLGVAYLATLVSGPGLAVLFALPVLVGLLLASTLSWTLRIDEDGFAVRSALGIPRFRVSLAEIASAAEVRVEPMVDFGGWGVRLGAGRHTGVVLRAGEAIEVTRVDGRRLTVTTADAARAASVLEALRRRHGAASAG